MICDLQQYRSAIVAGIFNPLSYFCSVVRIENPSYAMQKANPCQKFAHYADVGTGLIRLP